MRLLGRIDLDLSVLGARCGAFLSFSQGACVWSAESHTIAVAARTLSIFAQHFLLKFLYHCEP
jgi:hypothetical protein